jgi:hypothetical protein
MILYVSIMSPLILLYAIVGKLQEIDIIEESGEVAPRGASSGNHR